MIKFITTSQEKINEVLDANNIDESRVINIETLQVNLIRIWYT